MSEYNDCEASSEEFYLLTIKPKRCILLCMTYFFNYFLRATRTQLVLAFIYIPLLVAWGLPLSYMSLIGNIVFLPFLTIFLILSILIFVTELLFIPNLLLCTLLNIFTNIWFFFLRQGSTKWLIGFPNPGMCYLFLIPACGIGLYLLTRKTSLVMQCTIFSLFLFSILFFLKYIPIIPRHLHIPYKAAATIHYDSNKHLLVIPKIRITKNSFLSWFLYQANTTLYQQTGSATIDTLTALNPTKQGIATLKELKPIIGYQTILCTKTSPQKKVTYISYKK